MMSEIHSNQPRFRVLTSVSQGVSSRALATLVFCSAASIACNGAIETNQGATNDNTIGPDDVSGPVVPAGVDPGRVGIHRLNNTEYNNTVRDLLGTTLRPAEKFLAEEGFHFDNEASALGMTPAQYQGYFKAANDLMLEALASDAGRARFLTCTPTLLGDPCARQIVETFGMQIYRRPLEPSEVDRALLVYDAEVTRSSDGTEGIAQALRAMLSAANFLYRIEYDAEPASTVPHSLSGYELASRLSYLHWSSMPDQQLFDAAASGQLLDTAVLEATVDRLLADDKAQGFIQSFAGQWLDIQKLITHSTTPQVFPTYTAELADAMMTEGYLWFEEYLQQDRPISDWFSADFNFVNSVLAEHYGFDAPTSADEFVKVENTTDERRGFLGLANFLTHTSFPSRTSPTLRGAWVVSELLCDPPPPPPANVPQLEESADPTEEAAPAGGENVRARLERHRTDPACSGCHSLLDPIGLGLENFDGIGVYRDEYAGGDPIEPDGVLPGGTPFSGVGELGTLLDADPRFADCAASKLYTYALGREAEDYDAPLLDSIKGKWSARGLTLRNLMKEVVLSDAFRFRRGEVE